MLRHVRIAILTVLFGTSISPCQIIVEGKVVSPDGAPVPSSSVEAFPIQDGGFVGSLTWTRTDDKGNFRLNLRGGRYEIRAKDEEQGYPDPNALLSHDPNALFPEISVSEENISGVQVRLGPKGGILEGSVNDITTHGAIAQAKITIRDTKRPKAFVEVFSDKDGHFRFTVPSRPLSISASAPGYKTAKFPEGGPVTLSGGEHRFFAIDLDPR